jgi:hypothetical protein
MMQRRETRGSNMTIRTAVGLILIAGALSACTGRMQSASRGEPAPKPGPGVFFVATNGNDAWSGRFAAPNRNANDGPFATLPRALAATRDFKSGPESGQASTSIVIRGGTHFLSEPLALTPSDSHLNLVAYSGEQPILSGGRRITGWRETTVNGRSVWAADVLRAREGKWSFRELWINGRRAVRARLPNRGYLEVAELPDKTATWTDGHSRFRYREGDLKAWATHHQRGSDGHDSVG